MGKANFSESDGVANPGGAKAIAVIFIISLIAHAGFFFWRKSWYFLWFLVGLILEVVGYFQLSDGTIQSVCIIIAPIFLAASFYISLGKVLKVYGTQDLNPIKGFSIIFVIGDVISLGLQIAGIVIQFVKSTEIGRVMVIISFVLQILLFVAFLTTIIIVHKRMKYERFATYPETARRWNGYFITMYIVSSMFLVRNIFRLVEYAQGFSYIFLHAIFTLIFDGIPMMVVAFLLLVCHPSFYSMKRSLFKSKRDKENSAYTKQLSEDRKERIETSRAHIGSNRDVVTRHGTESVYSSA